MDVTETLSNGRSNYGIVELLISRLTGLQKAKRSDLQDAEGRMFEVKSYRDHEFFPHDGRTFQTSASCTFPANNHGPRIKALLSAGRYDEALRICRETGYDSNDSLAERGMSTSIRRNGGQPCPYDTWLCRQRRYFAGF